MNNKYIYIYSDPRKPGTWFFKNHVFKYKPFYVGVGSNKRIIAHLNESNLKQKTYKSSKIKSILKQKLLPIYFKIYENLNLADAFSLEKEIISHFGRSDIKTGILCNHTDGGIGWQKTKSLRKKVYKQYYKYSLDGVFQGVFSRKEIISQNINPNNISTAIKRNGTHADFIWYYEYKGQTIDSIIKYQMPRKFKNIKQINMYTGEIVNIYKDSKDVITKLNIIKGRSGLTNCITGRSRTFLNFKWEADIYEE